MSSSTSRVILPPFIEEEFASLIDCCCADAFMKSSSGFVIGLLTGTLFPKRRTWPMLFGMGFGLGFAYTSCELKLRSLCKANELNGPANDLLCD